MTWLGRRWTDREGARRGGGRRRALALGALALVVLVVCQVGVHVTLPGVDAAVLRDHVRALGGGNALLRLYDRLAAGGVSRGAVLALGVMPYASAWLLARLARVTSTRWTRALAVGLALVQGYGFATFAQSIPGAVAHPGPAFVARTMVLLALGTMLLAWLGERLAAPDDGAESDEDHAAELTPFAPVLPAPTWPDVAEDVRGPADRQRTR